VSSTLRSTPDADRWRGAAGITVGARRWQVALGTTARSAGPRNEDVVAVVAELRLVIVLDGMGGILSGARAGTVALEAIEAALRDGPAGTDPARLVDALMAANRVLDETAAREVAMRGCGATVVAALLDAEGATIAHLGHCRAHRVRGGALHTLTRDHDLHRSVVERGLSEAEASELARKHPGVLTRLLGGGHGGDPELGRVELAAGDRLVLTSDGVHRRLEAERLAALAAGADLEAAVQQVLDDIGPGDDDAAIAIIGDAGACGVRSEKGYASRP
jgi:serine/threonine protein phosphatase PrpC